MAYVNPATAATWGWEPTANSRTGRASEIERYRRTVGFFERDFLPRLKVAGVAIVAGTDAPVAMVIPGFAIHDELASYLAAGFTPLEALRTATTAAATVVPPRYGLDQLGTVAAGAPADLLVLSANPLEDLGNLKRRIAVIVRGRWFSSARLQRSLDSLAAIYRSR
jgi:imidazolonepropionase-like amidohydrolase